MALMLVLAPGAGLGALVLLGVGSRVLAVPSAPLGGAQAGLGGAGEAVRELGVGVLDWGAAAPLVAVLARLTASRRRREAGEPERRCARRERWLAPVGGRASLEEGPGVVRERGACVAEGGPQGLEGLGHLEDGSGQTGLRGLEAGP